MSEYVPSDAEQAAADKASEDQAAQEHWLASVLAEGRLHPYVHDYEGREPQNVGDYMRGEIGPPEMLLDGWLVKGVLHWLYSDAEAGKTWVALKLALDVIRQGEIVLWVDEELGALRIADRLIALGATPDEVETNLIYYPFPNWRFTPGDIAAWDKLLHHARPALVVFDTATDMLVAADLDENKGKDITEWVKAYPEIASARGVTTIVLDHTGKAEGGAPGKHAVGSRGKRAKSKVQYALTSKERYDRDKTGRVEVLLTKNTLGAQLEEKRAFKVGGDGEGGFIFEPTAVVKGDSEQLKRRNKIRDFLRERTGESFSQNRLTQEFAHLASSLKIKQDLAAMADGDMWPVKSEDGPRGSIQYSYDATLEDMAAKLVATVDGGTIENE